MAIMREEVAEKHKSFSEGLRNSAASFPQRQPPERERFQSHQLKHFIRRSKFAFHGLH